MNKSPCVGVCKLNEHLICYGCGRTIDQIQKSGERRSLPIVVKEHYNEAQDLEI